MTVNDLVGQVQLIQDAMKKVMKPDEHYGVIPGCKKPSLLKPGAEKLCFLFRLAPEFESVDTFDGAHLTVKTRCVLRHIPTGQIVGSGEGSCSTKETKYAYRNAALKCPACGKEAIIKGKAEYGGGWLCFAKRGGCGAKWPDGAKEIEGQEQGKVANENLADAYNTVLKMSNKRALVASVLVSVAASDLFTQDIEDMPHVGIAQAEVVPPTETPAHYTKTPTTPAKAAPVADRPQAPAANAAPITGAGNAAGVPFRVSDAEVAAYAAHEAAAAGEGRGREPGDEDPLDVPFTPPAQVPAPPSQPKAAHRPKADALAQHVLAWLQQLYGSDVKAQDSLVGFCAGFIGADGREMKPRVATLVNPEKAKWLYRVYPTVGFALMQRFLEAGTAGDTIPYIQELSDIEIARIDRLKFAEEEIAETVKQWTERHGANLRPF